MKPTLNQILMGAASTLSHDVAPNVSAPYAVGHVGTIGLIIACVAQEAERAVETAILEQDALRALFTDAATAPLPAALIAKLRRAGSNTARPSLKLADLDAQNAALMTLLDELLVTVEREQFDWAISLEKRIWSVLKAGADRRALYLPVL